MILWDWREKFYYLVQTAHVSSRCTTYGGHGSELQPPSTKYSKPPFLFPLVPGTYSGSLSTQTKSFWFGSLKYEVIRYPILLGPPSRTIVPRGHHQHWATWLDKADNTRRLVIMKISSERIPTVGADLIFSTVHISWVLIAVVIPVVLWIVWKTKVVYSTTLVIVPFTSH